MRYFRILSWIVILITAVVPVGSAFAQNDPNFETGFKPFGSYHGGNIDHINMTNGGLNVDIPLISYPQKGTLKLSYTLHYENLGDYSNEVQGFNEGGVRYHYYQDWGGAERIQHSFRVIQDDVPTLTGSQWPQDDFSIVASVQVLMPDHSMHVMAPTSLDGSTWESVDGTGFRTDSGVFFDSNGISYSGPIQDPNGNQITGSFPSITTDSLGRSIPSLEVYSDYSKCTGQNPITSATIWYLPGVNGGTYPILFCYITLPETDPIGTSNASGRGPAPSYYSNPNLLQSVVLLNDNEAWTFQYDTTYEFNDLATITFPTGGTLTYTWTSAPVCKTNEYTFNRSVAKRTLNPNDGTPTSQWNYNYAQNSGGYFSGGTVVTDPLGNDTVHTFTAIPVPVYGGGYYGTCSLYEAQTQYYQGLSTSGSAPLKATNTTYNSSEPTFWPLGYDALNVFANSTKTTLGNQQSQVQNDPDNAVTFWSPVLSSTTYAVDTIWAQSFTGMHGNTIATREYDYGGALLRTTSTSYIALSTPSYLANNLLKLPSSVQVTGAGPGSYTIYGYDEANRGNPSGARGNRTSVNRLLNTTGGYLTTSYVYSSAGLVTSSKDPNLNQTIYGYDGSCYAGSGPTSITNALNQTTNYCYDSNTGLLISRQDPNDIANNRPGTTYAYDSMSRLASVTYPDQGSDAYTYNISPSSPSFTFTKAIARDSQGSTIFLTETGLMDGVGRLTEKQINSDPSGTVYSDISYDGLGRKYQVWNPTRCFPARRNCGELTWGFTTYLYDGLSRSCLVAPQDAVAPSSSTCPTTAPMDTVFTTYSSNTTTVTDEAGKQRESETDGLGRLINVWEDPFGLGYQTVYQYDVLDNLTSVVQNGSRQRAFTYDSLSRLTRAVNPESGTTSYTYDADGNVLTKTDARTFETTYAYDALNDLTGKTYSDGDPAVSYAYSGTSCLGQLSCYNIGRRTAMSDAAGNEAWSYDSMGRVAVDQRTTNGVKLTTTYSTQSAPYNYDGSIAQLIYPSGRTMTYSTNGAAQTASAVDTANSVYYATLGLYTPNGALSTLLNGANILSTWYYNSRLQPCRIAVNSSGTAPNACTDTTDAGNVLDFTYGFNLGVSDNGNVADIANNGDTTRSQSFLYDTLNRLRTAQTNSTYATSPNNCWGEKYVYDNPSGPWAWGNLVQINEVSSAYNQCTQESLSMAVNSKNHLLDSNGNDTYYDAAGNMTTLPSGLSASYNAEGQISTINGISYVYDGDGKRVEKSTSGAAYKIYWYGLNGSPLAETDGDGNTTDEYIFFNGKRIAHRVGP